MITKAKEKLIKSLHTKKGRKESGLCLVEGEKVIAMASDLIEYRFGSDDTNSFEKLVTTETPQDVAAVVRVPRFNKEEVLDNGLVVVLDGIQDPGNVGAIMRLALGFSAGLVLIDSADPTSPKVIRSSVGAIFQVPWISIPRDKADGIFESDSRNVYRLEKVDEAESLAETKFESPCFLVLGSEGQGVKLEIEGKSVYIDHDSLLDSLNVAQAAAIVMYQLHK